MGSSNSSRRRRRMSNTVDVTGSDRAEHVHADAREDADDGPIDSDTEQSDLPAILAYLIRSGQVRILRSNEVYDNDDEYQSDDDEFCEPARRPQVDLHPDTSNIMKNDIHEEIMLKSGRSRVHDRSAPTVAHMVFKRETGMSGALRFNAGYQRVMHTPFLPNYKETVASYRQKAFCGTYSRDGDIFLTASQDQCVRIYDTAKDKFEQMKTIHARDVGWSVLDTAFSPDGNYMAYSSWSECIHLCSVHGDHDIHTALHLVPGMSQFCIFSLTFSSDNKEILGGANDGHLYVFDRDTNQRILKIDAHDDDVNTVAFADNTSQILFSGGDDGLCKTTLRCRRQFPGSEGVKTPFFVPAMHTEQFRQVPDATLSTVWDRRTLSETNPNPVGTMAGHTDGITYIDPKGDARYLLSNSKDQRMKLWDIRIMSSADAVEATKKEVSRQRWDYRWQQVPRKMNKKHRLPGDTSVMTYQGHSVLHTLIRCHFSPEFSTGQRYVYSGCATGSVVIYDTLTGAIVRRLEGHRSCVRDVSWHPYENIIMSTSWDGTVGKWEYNNMEKFEEYEEESFSSDPDDEELDFGLRRSRRLRRRRKVLKKSFDCKRQQKRRLFD